MRRRIRIGQDPWIGSGDKFKLPATLISHLKEKGISSLEDASSYTDRNQRGIVWKSVQELELAENDASVWNSYINQLKANFIHLNEEKDKLKWTWNTRDGKFSTKMGYEAAFQLEHQAMDC